MELKEQLSALEENLKADNKEMIEKALEELALDSRLKDSSDEVKAFVDNVIREGDEKLTEKFNKFSAELKEKRDQENTKPENYVENMKNFIADNMEKIGTVRKDHSIAFGKTEMKAVANMLVSGDHITGDAIRDYNRNPVLLPAESVNFADLVPTVNIDGGTYTYIRETAGEGAVTTQTEGSDKALVDFDYSHIDVTTDFLAGRTVYSKKMRNNTQYLQSVLPQGLRRKYFEAENAQFNTTLAAAATVSTNFIADVSNIAELVVKDVASLDIAKHNPNGIAMNKANWYDILFTEKSTGAGYGLPFGFTYDAATNTLRCLGMPVMKVDWVAATKYFVGDWSKVEKVVTEGLSLEFSEHERFSRNEIVARIEAQVALAVKQPASMIIGDTDATA